VKERKRLNKETKKSQLKKWCMGRVVVHDDECLLSFVLQSLWLVKIKETERVWLVICLRLFNDKKDANEIMRTKNEELQVKKCLMNNVMVRKKLASTEPTTVKPWNVWSKQALWAKSFIMSFCLQRYLNGFLLHLIFNLTYVYHLFDIRLFNLRLVVKLTIQNRQTGKPTNRKPNRYLLEKKPASTFATRKKKSANKHRRHLTVKKMP
jgi:hypothetical protein